MLTLVVGKGVRGCLSIQGYVYWRMVEKRCTIAKPSFFVCKDGILYLTYWDVDVEI